MKQKAEEIRISDSPLFLGGAMPKTPSQAETDSILRAAQLQDFDGFWAMNEDVAAMLGADLQKLIAAKPLSRESLNFLNTHGLIKMPLL